MRRALMLMMLSTGLVFGTAACGGGGGGEKAAKSKKKKKGKRNKVVEPEVRPPAKAPRPPFLSLPESDATAKRVLEEEKDRKLIGTPHRGPFGEGDSVTVIFTEPGEEEGTRRIGGVVVRNSRGHTIPVDNTGELAEDPTVVWASGEHGWQLVLMVQIAGEAEGEAPARVQANQVFYWGGEAFVRDLVAEKKVREMTAASAIRQAML